MPFVLVFITLTFNYFFYKIKRRNNLTIFVCLSFSIYSHVNLTFFFQYYCSNLFAISQHTTTGSDFGLLFYLDINLADIYLVSLSSFHSLSLVSFFHSFISHNSLIVTTKSNRLDALACIKSALTPANRFIIRTRNYFLFFSFQQRMRTKRMHHN